MAKNSKTMVIMMGLLFSLLLYSAEASGDDHFDYAYWAALEEESSEHNPLFANQPTDLQGYGSNFSDFPSPAYPITTPIFNQPAHSASELQQTTQQHEPFTNQATQSSGYYETQFSDLPSFPGSFDNPTVSTDFQHYAGDTLSLLPDYSNVGPRMSGYSTPVFHMETTQKNVPENYDLSAVEAGGSRRRSGVRGSGAGSSRQIEQGTSKRQPTNPSMDVGHTPEDWSSLPTNDSDLFSVVAGSGRQIRQETSDRQSGDSFMDVGHISEDWSSLPTDDSDIFSVVAGSGRQISQRTSGRQPTHPSMNEGYISEDWSSFPTNDSDIYSVVAGSGRHIGQRPSGRHTTYPSMNEGHISEDWSSLPTDDSDIFSVVAGSGRRIGQETSGYGYNPGSTASVDVPFSSNRHFAPFASPIESFDQSSRYDLESSGYYGAFQHHGGQIGDNSMNVQQGLQFIPSSSHTYDEGNIEKFAPQDYDSNLDNTHGTSQQELLNEMYASSILENMAGHTRDFRLHAQVNPSLDQSVQHAYGKQPMSHDHGGDLNLQPSIFERGQHNYISDFEKDDPISQRFEESAASSSGRRGCILSIRQLPTNHGLIMSIEDTIEYKEKLMYPTSRDGITIGEGQVFVVQCFKKNYLTHVKGKRVDSISVKCERGQFILIEKNTPLNDNDTICENVPPYRFRFQKDSTECGKHSHYQMGYSNSVTSGLLTHVIYNVCIDRTRFDRTLYVWYTLDNHIQGSEPLNLDVKYTPPIGGTTDSPYNLHTGTNERYLAYGNALKAQLESEDLVKELTNRHSVKVTKGRLASISDFPYRSEKLSTLNYVNVVPMWSNLGAYWEKFEEAVSSFAAARKNPLTIISGTSENQTFKNKDGVPIDLYFFKARAKKGSQFQSHYPKYVWKIVFDPITMQCVILVGNNSAIPFAKRCPDVTHTVKWLHTFLRANPGVTRILYACRCEHFVPDDLPDFYPFK